VLDFEAIRIEPDAADHVARDPAILEGAPRGSLAPQANRAARPSRAAGRPFRRVPRKKLSHAQQGATLVVTTTLVSVP